MYADFDLKFNIRILGRLRNIWISMFDKRSKTSNIPLINTFFNAATDQSCLKRTSRTILFFEKVVSVLSTISTKNEPIFSQSTIPARMKTCLIASFHNCSTQVKIQSMFVGSLLLGQQTTNLHFQFQLANQLVFTTKETHGENSSPLTANQSVAMFTV